VIGVDIGYFAAAASTRRGLVRVLGAAVLAIEHTIVILIARGPFARPCIAGRRGGGGCAVMYFCVGRARVGHAGSRIAISEAAIRVSIAICRGRR
jgi:hypothetical protein